MSTATTTLNLSIPEHIAPLRQKVLDFIEQRIYPIEKELAEGDPVERRRRMRALMDQAKAEGLWALGHPREIGGGGLPFMDYVFVNEVIGRSSFATVALGTHSLQDSATKCTGRSAGRSGGGHRADAHPVAGAGAGADEGACDRGRAPPAGRHLVLADRRSVHRRTGDEPGFGVIRHR